MIRKILIAALMTAAFLCGHAHMAGAGAVELVQTTASGSINWTRRFVQAEGVGTRPAEDADTPAGWEKAVTAAKRKAYANLLETVKAIRLSRHRRVGDVLVGNDAVLAKMEQLLNSAQTEDVVYRSDGRVKVTRRMSMTGAFSQLILPESIVQLETIHLGWTALDSKEEVFTGMVVDARGIDVLPAMCFSIMDEDGREVYGPAYVSREFVVQKGMCGYVTDMAATGQSGRAGHNPLVVKALKTRSPAGTDIVISDTDASRLRSSADNLFFLRKCRVIVVGSPFRKQEN